VETCPVQLVHVLRHIFKGHYEDTFCYEHSYASKRKVQTITPACWEVTVRHILKYCAKKQIKCVSIHYYEVVDATYIVRHEKWYYH
jgi:hypothetical protein